MDYYNLHGEIQIPFHLRHPLASEHTFPTSLSAKLGPPREPPLSTGYSPTVQAFGRQRGWDASIEAACSLLLSFPKTFCKGGTCLSRWAGSELVTEIVWRILRQIYIIAPYSTQSGKLNQAQALAIFPLCSLVSHLKTAAVHLLALPREITAGGQDGELLLLPRNLQPVYADMSLPSSTQFLPHCRERGFTMTPKTCFRNTF